MKTVIKILSFEKDTLIQMNKLIEPSKEDLQKIAEIDQALQLLQTDVSSSFSLNNYQELDINVLQKISFLHEKIFPTFEIKDNIHEDIIEYLEKPFREILIHHGVNLSEQDF